jgi:hypothetical protein
VGGYLRILLNSGAKVKLRGGSADPWWQMRPERGLGHRKAANPIPTFSPSCSRTWCWESHLDLEEKPAHYIFSTQCLNGLKKSKRVGLV